MNTKEIANKPLSSPRWSSQKWLEFKPELDSTIAGSNNSNIFPDLISDDGNDPELVEQTYIYLRQQRAQLLIARHEAYVKYAVYGKEEEDCAVTSGMDGDVDEIVGGMMGRVMELLNNCVILTKDIGKLGRMEVLAKAEYEKTKKKSDHN